MFINDYNVVVGSQFQTNEGHLLTIEYRELDTNICKKTQTVFIYNDNEKNYLDISYKEFISQFDETNRMMLPEFEEPQVPESVKKFIERRQYGKR